MSRQRCPEDRFAALIGLLTGVGVALLVLGGLNWRLAVAGVVILAGAAELTSTDLRKVGPRHRG